MRFFLRNRISRRKEREKRMQRKRKEKGERLFDRLPDDILVHILSFMSTRDCVRSSILGKRWRLLWARVPNLKFDSVDHRRTMTSFSNFVDRFAFVHKGHNINTLRIAYPYKSGIETLVATAIACNVQVIDIRNDFELVLPQCLFICKTLVDLTLNRICLKNVPMTGTRVYLPALKKLELSNVRCESEESLEHLLSGCPALQELTIYKAADDVVCLNISSPTLTRLDLETEYARPVYKDFEVKLDTPALEYLRLHDYYSSHNFSAGMLSSLTKADVVFTDHSFFQDDVLYPHSVLEFVDKLNNVSSLKLITRWKWVQAPNSAFCALTTEFRNLTKLELAGDWRFVTYFLQNSDNLQVLITDMLQSKNIPNWMEPKRVPVCLKYHLRKVRFEDFEYSEAEFNMVEYILRNAKVLKKMKICFPCNHLDLKKESEAVQRISLFERASKACQLAFD